MLTVMDHLSLAEFEGVQLDFHFFLFTCNFILWKCSAALTFNLKILEFIKQGKGLSLSLCQETEDCLKH